MGKLYLVPTPIGNLKDITLRAIETLSQVDLILAEDTRTTKKLLNHYDIKTKTKSYHIYNEHKTLNEIIGRTDLLKQVSTGSSHLDDLDLHPLFILPDSGNHKRYSEKKFN